jgi:hypothetical protein
VPFFEILRHGPGPFGLGNGPGRVVVPRPPRFRGPLPQIRPRRPLVVGAGGTPPIVASRGDFDTGQGRPAGRERRRRSLDAGRKGRSTGTRHAGRSTPDGRPRERRQPTRPPKAATGRRPDEPAGMPATPRRGDRGCTGRNGPGTGKHSKKRGDASGKERRPARTPAEPGRRHGRHGGRGRRHGCRRG